MHSLRSCAFALSAAVFLTACGGGAEADALDADTLQLSLQTRNSTEEGRSRTNRELRAQLEDYRSQLADSRTRLEAYLEKRAIYLSALHDTGNSISAAFSDALSRPRFKSISVESQSTYAIGSIKVFNRLRRIGKSFDKPVCRVEASLSAEGFPKLTLTESFEPVVFRKPRVVPFKIAVGDRSASDNVKDYRAADWVISDTKLETCDGELLSESPDYFMGEQKASDLSVGEAELVACRASLKALKQLAGQVDNTIAALRRLEARPADVTLDIPEIGFDPSCPQSKGDD